MTETTKTLSFVGAAALLAAAATASAWMPDWRGPGAAFSDQGQLFFPELEKKLETDPLAARSLEVIDYNESTASAIPFQVVFEKGDWTIPSHYDFPADAADRIARLAADMVRLKKDAVRSDRVEDHASLGVVDPMEDKATSLTGRGKRVTLRDRAGGQALADLIIGKEVPGRPSQRFVRVPGQRRTYAANLTFSLTTKFNDWIKTDLLTLTNDQIKAIEFDRRSVDINSGRLLDGEVFRVEHETPTGKPDRWLIEGISESEEVDTSKVSQLVTAADTLQIVGVRPLPKGDRAQLNSLVSKGFYPTNKGFFSDQGSVSIDTKDGTRYGLRFGKVTFAQGDELTAGSPEEDSAEGAGEKKPAETSKPEGDAKKDGEGTESRFLIVQAEFVPELLPPIDEGGRLPADVFQRDPNDPIRKDLEAKEAKRVADRDAARAKQIEDGKKKVDEQNRTFASWYFVIPGDSFRKIILDRASLVRAKGSAPEPSTTIPQGLPGGLQGLQGLPGGFPGGLPQLPPGH